MAGELISLDVGEFFFVWTQLGLGEPPTMLAVEHIGRTEQARARYIEAAGRALRERGLGNAEQPARRLAEPLRMVADAPLRVELLVEDPDYTVRAVGASKGAESVVLARFDTEIRVIPLHPDELAPVLFEALRPMDPGVGAAANVQVSDYERACAAGVDDGQRGFERALLQAGLPGHEAMTVAEAVGGRIGGGRLTAMSAHDGGPFERVKAPLSWLDTPDGRYSMRRRDEWIMVSPVEHSRLVEMAAELLAPLAEDAPDPLSRWT